VRLKEDPPERWTSSGRGSSAGQGAIAWGRALRDGRAVRRGAQGWWPTIHYTGMVAHYTLYSGGGPLYTVGRVSLKCRDCNRPVLWLPHYQARFSSALQFHRELEGRALMMPRPRARQAIAVGLVLPNPRNRPIVYSQTELGRGDSHNPPDSILIAAAAPYHSVSPTRLTENPVALYLLVSSFCRTHKPEGRTQVAWKTNFWCGAGRQTSRLL
jgi:hypothetical protein